MKLQILRRCIQVSTRLLLVGILAVALHNFVDFNLEFLGVAAPMAAIAGAVAPHRKLRGRLVARASALAMLATTGVALLALPGTYSMLRREKSETTVESISNRLLGRNPLDPHYHLVLGRHAAEQGDWDGAVVRARIATIYLSPSVDAWLLRSAAEDATGDHEASDQSLRRALSNLREVADEPLVAHLVSRRSPAALAALAPTTDAPWARLAEGLARHAVEHADALARARLAAAPTDVLGLRFAAQIALRQHRFVLARHHATLLRQAAPHDARGHLLLANALRGLGEEEAARVVSNSSR